MNCTRLISWRNICWSIRNSFASCYSLLNKSPSSSGNWLNPVNTFYLPLWKIRRVSLGLPLYPPQQMIFIIVGWVICFGSSMSEPGSFLLNWVFFNKHQILKMVLTFSQYHTALFLPYSICWKPVQPTFKGRLIKLHHLKWAISQNL